jgi:hypothetical protein
MVAAVRAVPRWPVFGFCGTCRRRTSWLEATVENKTNLICENCGRVSPKETTARTRGGWHYEGYCRKCAAATLWAVRKTSFWSAPASLFCCNCGHEGYACFDTGKTEVFLARCSNCEGETLWHEDSRGDGVYCLSCSRREPVTFKVWLERAPAGSGTQPEDETRAY